VIIPGKAFRYQNLLGSNPAGRFILFLCVMLEFIFGTNAADYEAVCYIQFQQQTFRVCQNESNAVITVSRSGDFRDRAIVDYQANDGTATAGEDYKAVGGQLIFAPFENQKTFSIPIISNHSATTNRTVQLTLRNAAYHAMIVQPEATLYITSDVPALAPPPPISIANESNGMIAVSWPGERIDCSVERTDDPSRPWTTISTPPFQVEGTLVIEEPATNNLYFYRLRLK
jgi:hypothetical protein